MKPLKWLGSSYSRLNKFPPEAMREAGFELKQVQSGFNASDWKPINRIGSGAIEIRIHNPHEYRVVYIAKYPEAVYVLHAFEKKTEKTSERDLKIARTVYAQLQQTQKENR